jgi:hypothetical protein
MRLYLILFTATLTVACADDAPTVVDSDADQIALADGYTGTWTTGECDGVMHVYPRSSGWVGSALCQEHFTDGGSALRWGTLTDEGSAADSAHSLLLTLAVTYTRADGSKASGAETLVSWAVTWDDEAALHGEADAGWTFDLHVLEGFSAD